MSAPEPAVVLEPTVAPDADKQVVLKHVAIKGVQLFACISPPVLLAHAAYRRSFRLSTFLRNSALSTFVLGTSFGLGLGYAKVSGMDAAGVVDRAYRLKMNAGQVRVDDYSMIGGVLGALITPTIFLRRAPAPYLVAGGAALGIAGGVVAHVVKNKQDGTTAGVGMMVAEAKELAGK